MVRAYQAVLQPTRRQAVALARLVEAQRELYNAALEERRGAWRCEQRSVSRFEQFGELTGWDHPVLEFGVCPARGTLTRLDRAFKGFYRRCRRGERPGFPRFRSAARWDSVEYPDRACWRVDQRRGGVGRLVLKGVGAVRFRGPKRGLRGSPKTLTIRREGQRWRLTVFCTDVPAVALAPTGTAVGIDLVSPSWWPPLMGSCWATPAICGPRDMPWTPASGWWLDAIGGRSGAVKRPGRWGACTAGSPGNAAISPTNCPAGWSTTTT